MKLNPYPDYRDSGLPWLKKIPSHWQVLRNGQLFTQRNETGYGSLPILEVSLKTGVRIRDMENGKRKQVMSDREGYKRAVQGDIAYNMMRMWQGAVGVAPVDGLVSPAYVVARPFPNVNPRYFSYLFRTAAYMREVDGYSRGIVKDRNRLYWQDFKRMPSCVPPLEEQNAIVRFLDWKFGQFSRLIRNKQKLIQLLQEQKKLVVNKAVTNGVVSDVKFQSSGVDYLGNIPEHWKVRRLKTLVDNINDQTSTKSVGDVYIALEHIESWSGAVTPPQNNISFDSQVKRFKSDDVLFCKLRPYLAKVARLDTKGVCVGELLVLRIRSNSITPSFLEHKLRSVAIINLVNSSTFGAKMPRADWSFIGNLLISYPPCPIEQSSIVKHIDDSLALLCRSINSACREIDLVREYQNRLIADVVFGTVDIQDVSIVTEDEQDSISECSIETEMEEDLEEALDAD